MDATDLFVLASPMFSIMGLVVIWKLHRANKELHRHLQDMARDYQIEKHRADVYFMRLRERQRHDGYGASGPN